MIQTEIKKKPHIIVIDDEGDILEVYRTILSRYYQVTAYMNPLDFLNAIHAKDFKKPDLVITDLKMPHMDGLEMLNQAIQKGLTFPSILLSGHLDKDSAIQAIDIGVFKLLEKPTDFDVLLSSIDQIMLEHEVYKVRQEIREITKQLKELYGGIRIVLMQHIPADIIDRILVETNDQGQVVHKMSFEDLLEKLEMRLDYLLKSEHLMNEMRINKIKYN